MLAAITLPGLPIAAVLRLPRNGIFASVATGVSLATTLLVSQAGTVIGLGQPYFSQTVIVVVTWIAVAVLVDRRRPASELKSGSPMLASSRAKRIAWRRRGSRAILLVASSVLFLSAVARLETQHSNAFGIIGILGVEYFIGLALLCVVLGAEYRGAVIDPMTIAASNVMLIVYTAMPVAWADRTAPFATAYVHRHIANWIAEIGTLPPAVDARMSWAGFFSGAAQLMKVGSLPDSDTFVVNASLFFGVLMIYPVYAIGISVSGNPRAAWVGVTIYILFNWYQQDYFAPQAVAMQLYATVLAVLLWQLRGAEVPSLVKRRLTGTLAVVKRMPGRVVGRDRRWYHAMEVVLLLLISAIVVSHQLTPLVVIAAASLFSALGVTRYKILWSAAIVVFTAWFTYGADNFWEGHLREVLAEVGGVTESVGASVSARVSGDLVYSRMQYLRIVAAASLFVIGAFGWRRIGRDKCRPILAALALVPFTLILVQSYGGEVVIRCFLYASPVLAPLAAWALQSLVRARPRSESGSKKPVAVAALLFFALAVVATTNRGLNTSFEHTTYEELSIATRVVDAVGSDDVAYWGPGSLMGTPKSYDLGPNCIESNRKLAECTADEGLPYVVLTRQDEKFLQYRFGVEPDDFGEAILQLVTDKNYDLIYDGEYIDVLRRPDAPRIELGVGQ
ncbi:hypothetical protein [Mycolicibacterium baixiangningiae]|uniref:hypothetical protein n=1 Tax=Mycolicibacterium baixiangningiae TaxID=2761578 RepID=UPI001868E45F|nr:hypothetical protein [Mycolicibacterium baixiangningiae]